ncbi:MAG: glycosyltransferase [Ignavibacteria bacterium]
MAEISIVIVTWNAHDEILNCLESVMVNIRLLKDIETEIIIIDNHSSDNTVEIINNLKFDNIKIFQNDSNSGFTKAANRGICMSAGKYIFLLNPDTIMNEDCIGLLYDFLKANEGYGAASPRLLNADGTIQYSIRNFPDYPAMFFEHSLLSYIFPRSRTFSKWKMEYFDYTQDADVLQPMAAALMIRKSELEKTGNMDERFEMFFNDVDLCMKIIQNGSKIRYLTEAAAMHIKGASIYKTRARMIKTWNKDCIKYFEKYRYNFILINWLKITLFFSGILRIAYHKYFKRNK